MITIKEFKCPLCGGVTSFHIREESDKWRTAWIDCDDSTDKFCGLTMKMGAYGKGVKDIEANVTEQINWIKR